MPQANLFNSQLPFIDYHNLGFAFIMNNLSGNLSAINLRKPNKSFSRSIG